jgi:hypothetical protein
MNFDLNIKNYSIQELQDIFSLPFPFNVDQVYAQEKVLINNL